MAKSTSGLVRWFMADQMPSESAMRTAPAPPTQRVQELRGNPHKRNGGKIVLQGMRMLSFFAQAGLVFAGF